MKAQMGFSALTLLAACGLGVMLGRVMNDPRPNVALAKAAAGAGSG